MISLPSKKNIEYVLLASILLFSSCKFSDNSRFAGFEKVIDVEKIKAGNGKGEGPLTTINIPHLDSSHFDYAKSLTDIRFVKLETTPKSKFGQISKLFFANDRIFVVDLKVTECIFIFDNEGRYVNKIDPNDKTQNPNAATHFFSATFNYNKDEIVLHDDKKDTILNP